mgnify:CR=1 FL=1|jgi:hypothetical protein
MAKHCAEDFKQSLYKLAEAATQRMDELTKDNKLDYAVVYDEFDYQASSWDYPRRVIVKVEKLSNQFTYQYGSKSCKYS